MELFKLFGTIAINNSAANDAIEETGDKAEDAKKDIADLGDEGGKSESKLGTAFSKIGSAAVTVGKTIAAGLAVGSAAVAKITKDAVSAYSDYEQLVGGVETLFGESSTTIIENASNAYKTAGMSANDYMETVTSFSASLLQSLDGDTTKAAEKADMAITDMSDNANKMGTDIASIQTAYQSFAKQNYTMLDNLKLGYGGTKEEMERLLEDASKISGIEYDVSSYSDIVDAIHVVQTEMGITGTTAKEASTTIQGSLSSAKSAWQNLLTGLADGNQDFSALVQNFFDSIVTVADNVVPRVAQVLDTLPSLITQLVPQLITKVSEIIDQLLPSVIQGATSLINAIIGVIPQLVTALLAALPELISGIEQVFYAIVDALPTLIQVLCEALPTLIPQLVTAIINMAVYLMEHIAEILQPIIDNLPNIIISIVNALMENLPTLINGLIQMVLGIVQAIPQIILGLVEALPTIITSIIDGLINALPQLIQGLVQLIIELVKAIPQIILALIEAIPTIIVSIVEALWGCAQSLWDAFSGIFSGAWDGIVSIFSGIGEWFSGIFSGVVDAIKNIWNGLTGFFQGLWEGIWNIIKVPINWIIDGINTLWSGIYSAVKGIVDSIGGIAGAIGSIFGQDWSFSMPADPPLIPKLAKGTVVDEATPAIIGEDGAEAVVPLENNTTWIQRVAKQIHEFTIKTKNESGDISSNVSADSTLISVIRSEVGERIKNLEATVTSILDMLKEYFPELLDAFDVTVVLDDGTMVAKLTPKIDRQLGIIQKRKERG